MYKKIVACYALISVSAYASDIRPLLEIKPSYFFFSSSLIKHIYHKGCFEIQGSLSIPVCDYVDFYGSVGYRKTQGRAFNTCEKTTLSVLPVDIGLRPIFKLCKCLYYSFAIGPRFFRLHQHNNSPYVDCKIKGNGVGFFAYSDITASVSDCVLFGIFGEYSYEKKKLCSKMQNVYSNGKIQIGGFACGVTLGYIF